MVIRIVPDQDLPVMSATRPAVDPAPRELRVSSSSWETIRTAAFVGRISLIGAALLTVIAAFVNRPVDGPLVIVCTTILALAMGILAGFGLVRPQRGFDLGATVIALLLAGAEAVQAFGFIGKAYYGTLFVMPMLAWLALLVGGLALATVLLPGPVAENPAAVANAVGRATAAGPGYGPAAAGTPGGYPFPGAGGAAVAGASAFGATAVVADPEPGWYPSPDGETARRWDGETWTGERRPLSDFDDEGE